MCLVSGLENGTACRNPIQNPDSFVELSKVALWKEQHSSGLLQSSMHLLEKSHCLELQLQCDVENITY